MLVADPAGRTPDEEIAAGEAMRSLERALRGLPLPQREAFMLRTFEGCDVRDTALAMGVSEGRKKPTTRARCTRCARLSENTGNERARRERA